MKSNRGQALVEYVLIIVLVSLLLFGAVKVFGGYLMDKITEAGCNISDKEYVEGESPGEATCEDKIEE